MRKIKNQLFDIRRFESYKQTIFNESDGQFPITVVANVQVLCRIRYIMFYFF